MNDFLQIPCIADYILQGLTNGTLCAFSCAKMSAVTAHVGTVGETVHTVMKNGLEETVNRVSADSQTGHPDWIVTNPNGERYVISDAVFREKYVADPDTADRFIAAGKAVTGVRTNENICFTAPWGEMQYIAAGGVLIVNGKDDIYGIQPEEFAQTYRILPEQPADLTRQTIALLQ